MNFINWAELECFSQEERRFWEDFACWDEIFFYWHVGCLKIALRIQGWLRISDEKSFRSFLQGKLNYLEIVEESG